MAKTYSEKLRSPKWQKRRLEIMSRDQFTCKYCKDIHTSLNVHHHKYNGAPWQAKDDDLETVCEHYHKHICHNKNVDANNILSVEKILEEWAVCYIVSMKDKDIIMTIGREENVIIFQKNSMLLKRLAKVNKIKNG